MNIGGLKYRLLFFHESPDLSYRSSISEASRSYIALPQTLLIALFQNKLINESDSLP